MRKSKLWELNPSAIYKRKMVFVPLLAIGKLRNGGILLTPLRHDAEKIVFAQFTKVGSIHRGFYKWKKKDDNQKKFIPRWKNSVSIANPHKV